MKRVLIVAGIAVILLLSCIILQWYVVTYLTLDKNGMENPEAPMLDLLSAEWVSEDGV